MNEKASDEDDEIGDDLSGRERESIIYLWSPGLRRRKETSVWSLSGLPTITNNSISAVE